MRFNKASNFKPINVQGTFYVLIKFMTQKKLKLEHKATKARQKPDINEEETQLHSKVGKKIIKFKVSSLKTTKSKKNNYILIF